MVSENYDGVHQELLNIEMYILERKNINPFIQTNYHVSVSANGITRMTAGTINYFSNYHITKDDGRLMFSTLPPTGMNLGEMDGIFGFDVILQLEDGTEAVLVKIKREPPFEVVYEGILRLLE